MNQRKLFFLIVMLSVISSNYIFAEYHPSIFTIVWTTLKDTWKYSNEPEKFDKKFNLEEKLSIANTLPEIDAAVKECEADELCHKILTDSDVQAYIRGARNKIIGELQGVVNVALMSAKFWVYFDLRKGLNITVGTNETALHFLIVGLSKIDLSMLGKERAARAIDALIKNGANINAVNGKGRTPLMLAAFTGQIGIVKFLVENGADVTIKDNEGKTAADYARVFEKANEQDWQKNREREESHGKEYGPGKLIEMLEAK